MPIAIDPNEQTEYVLKCDRNLPPEQQSVFLIVPLTVAQTRACESKSRSVTRGETVVEGSAVDWMHEVLRFGLKGWRNFKNRAGDEVVFVSSSDGRAGDQSLARINFEDRSELSAAIFSLGKIDEGDVGKSVP